MAESQADENEVGTVPGPGIRTEVVAKFALASLAMVAVPTGLFLLSLKGYFDGIYAQTIGVPSDRNRGLVSGALGVVGVNAVVVVFIVLAMTEKDVTKAKRQGFKSD